MLGSKPTRRYCRYCGSSVTPTDAFCSSCGERLVPREGIARDNRAATVPSRAETRHASFSRFWPASASREIVAGVMVAVSVVVLLVGLVYGLLMLRGAFADPSVPRTLGLVVFSLVHGGAFSVSVPPSPSLLGIGGSFLLGLPPTSFALLPFVALLVLGRFVARRTESTLLFACSTAITYALVVSLLAALGSISVAGADEGATTVRYAADPLSAGWRAFLIALVGVLLGAAVAHGPLLPERIRQVLRGAFVAIGISLIVTVLLAVILVVVQGAEAPTQQVADSQATQLVREDSPTGESLAGVGVLFALLPAILGTLWLFAHGLPMGLQGAQDLATIPLIGQAFADAPLQVSLFGTWPGGNAWRLLLLGPVIGLVAGGMLAARGAPQNERRWQGALVAVPYVAFATLVAVLFRITAEISVSGLTLDLALGASLPWLLALLVVGGALGAIGGLLAGRGTVWAANPRLAFLATALLSAILLVGSLPSALAFQPQESSKLLSSTSPAVNSTAFEAPEGSAKEAKTKTSSASSSPSPAPASTKRQGQDQQEEASEESLRRAVEDYYEAVDRGDWDYTYTNLDSQSRQMFTREEWSLKNQYFANNGSLNLSSFDITEISPSGTEATVSLGPPYSRDTYFIYEDGSWKHRLSGEEVNLFMPGVPFEDFVKAHEGDSTDDEASSTPSPAPAKRTVTSSVKPKSTVTTPPPSPPARSAPSPTPTPDEPSPPPQATKSSGADCSSGVRNVPVAPGSKGDRDGDGTACEK